MLGDRNAGRGRDQGGGGRQVDRAEAVAARPCGAQHGPDRIGQPYRARAECHRGADQFVDGLALDPQGHEEAGDLRGFAVIVDKGADGCRHFVGGQIFAAGDFFKDIVQHGGGSSCFWLRIVVSETERARQLFLAGPVRSRISRFAERIGSVDQARTPAGPCEQRHHHMATAAPAGAVTILPNRVRDWFTANPRLNI